LIPNDRRPTIQLKTPPRRIVSQAVGSDNILLQLCPERLIAVSALARDRRYSFAAEEVERRAIPAAPTSEAVLALRPDLVICANYASSEHLDRLDQAGLQVLRINRFATIADIDANIRLLGAVTDCDEAADRLATTMQARIAAAVASIQRPPQPLRILGWSYGTVLGRGTTFDEISTLLGAINIASAAGLEGWPHVGIEQILAWDPDAIVIPDTASDQLDSAAAMAAFLTEHPPLARLRATREGRIIVLPARLMGTVSHHIASYAEALASQLYPQR
jgi:iron complex transport system substrate-binding protein